MVLLTVIPADDFEQLSDWRQGVTCVVDLRTARVVGREDTCIMYDLDNRPAFMQLCESH